MVFCRGCGKELHESAPVCPQCGSLQNASVSRVANTPASAGQSLWASITSLVFGVICMLALLDDSEWDRDTIVGLGMFAALALVFGIVSLNVSRRGRGMAIAGIVMGAVGLLCAIGLS